MKNLKKFNESQLNEKYIGAKGKARVAKMLHKLVDKYVKAIEEQSDDADDAFFVKDFASWYRENN